MDAEAINARLKNLEDLSVQTQAAVNRMTTLLESIVRMEERQVALGEAVKRAHKRLDGLEADNRECERWRNQRDGAAWLTGKFAAPLWAAVAAAVTAAVMHGGLS